MKKKKYIIYLCCKYLCIEISLLLTNLQIIYISYQIYVLSSSKQTCAVKACAQDCSIVLAIKLRYPVIFPPSRSPQTWEISNLAENHLLSSYNLLRCVVVRNVLDKNGDNAADDDDVPFAMAMTITMTCSMRQSGTVSSGAAPVIWHFEGIPRNIPKQHLPRPLLPCSSAESYSISAALDLSMGHAIIVCVSVCELVGVCVGGVTGSWHAASPIHPHRTETFINKLSLLLSNSASYIAASTPSMPSPRYTTKCCLASTSGMLRSLAGSLAVHLCVCVLGESRFRSRCC